MKFVRFAMLAIGLTFAAGSVTAPAYAAGDADKGKKVFAKCKACHQVVPGKKGLGPNLSSFLGRKAGTLDDYAKKYSADMKAAGEKGLVWDDKTFVDYIADPKAYLGSKIGKKKAKTKMAFNGLKKADDRENLLAYLKSVAK